MEMGQNRPLCVVAGAGPGNGMAFGRRFLSAGYQVVLLARNPQMLQPLIKAVPDAGAMTALACDLTDLASIAATFDQLQAEMGSVDTLLYNAGSGLLDNIDSFDAASFEQEWRINQLGLLQTAQQVLPGMRQRQSGNIIVTGATASWRGTANFMSFAAAKAGQGG